VQRLTAEPTGGWNVIVIIAAHFYPYNSQKQKVSNAIFATKSVWANTVPQQSTISVMAVMLT